MPSKPKTKAAAAAAAAAAAHADEPPSLADQMSYLHHPRPFKNPAFLGRPAKRAKTIKQIMTADREREQVYRDQAKAKAKEAMEVDGQAGDNVNGAVVEEQVFYSSIEAAPSILPQKKYCDITGLEGPYTHPTSGLRYHDRSIYEVVKSLNPSAQQAYLSARGLNSLVK